MKSNSLFVDNLPPPPPPTRSKSLIPSLSNFYIATGSLVLHLKMVAIRMHCSYTIRPLFALLFFYPLLCVGHVGSVQTGKNSLNIVLQVRIYKSIYIL